ncbi:hypothetical protein [Micromonospora haikouensis]|uniref:hypothetical protein n=1 Tax=Micromonospora haikouensis TaxID=686309 RepID=UPI003D7026AE
MSEIRGTEHFSYQVESGGHVSYLLVSIVTLTVAVVMVIIDHATPVEMASGGYAVLAAVSGAAFVGWVVRSSAAMLLRKVHESHQWMVSQVATPLPAGGAPAPEPATTPRTVRASCRLATGRTYVSTVAAAGGGDGDTVGILSPTVDAATVPTFDAVRKAREDGVEEGFDIGLKVRLADMGVVPLERRRRS